MMHIVWQRRHIAWILVFMPAIFGYSRTGSGGEDGSVGESQKMTLAACCDRDPGKDINTLGAAGNDEPEGIWSDGTTMWVADDQFGGDEKIYAYAMASGDRDPGKDFDTLDDAGNGEPEGIWSDGTTMWVADDPWFGEKIFAYTLATRARDPDKDINTLEAAANDNPEGIWSDGSTMWVADMSDEKIYAYTMATGARDSGKDINTLDEAGNDDPTGIWSDGTTMWVADGSDARIYAYSLTPGVRDPGKDIDALDDAGNDSPTGIWSDGTTMWVADDFDHKIYAYDMPPPSTATTAPTIHSLTAGRGSFTITWAAPSSTGGSVVTAYDLRYIASNAPDKADANWTVVDDIWTTGSGALSYGVTGLTGGRRYDVQVRAVIGSGEGLWSVAHAVTTMVRAPATTDFNGDGRTDFIDFFLFADAFGSTDPRFDLDGNGRVDFADFFRFVDAFGT
ncbi:MAG: fibronectin type III domain-containing protein [Gemmatimonadetes bacterium]|nr:fibronectin type III domain-containing protein [Gemmatimonadota bacterium]